MVNNKAIHGYGPTQLSEEAFDTRANDHCASARAAVDVAEVLGAWLSLRGILFAPSDQLHDRQPFAVQEISAQSMAAMATPEVRVNPWGTADCLTSAPQRRNSGVEGN